MAIVGVKPPRRDRVEDRLQIAAAPRDQNSEAAIHDRFDTARRGCARLDDVADRDGRRTSRHLLSSMLRDDAPPRLRAHDDDQPDAHVERSEHLVGRDGAALLQQLNSGGTCHDAVSIARRAALRQHPRQILGDAAAGDVRHAFHQTRRRAAASRREIRPMRREQRVADRRRPVRDTTCRR